MNNNSKISSIDKSGYIPPQSTQDEQNKQYKIINQTESKSTLEDTGYVAFQRSDCDVCSRKKNFIIKNNNNSYGSTISSYITNNSICLDCIVKHYVSLPNFNVDLFQTSITNSIDNYWSKKNKNK